MNFIVRYAKTRLLGRFKIVSPGVDRSLKPEVYSATEKAENLIYIFHYINTIIII